MTQFGGEGGSFGPNAWLVDDMYDRFLADPGSVSDSWREFFADYRSAPVPAPQPAVQPQPQAQPAASVAAAPAPAPVAAAADLRSPIPRGAASSCSLTTGGPPAQPPAPGPLTWPGPRVAE